MYHLWAWNLQWSNYDGVGDDPYVTISMVEADDALESTQAVAILTFWSMVGGGMFVNALKVNLMATRSLTTSQPAIPTIHGTCATKEGSSKAMVGHFMGRGLPMPALVDGYCGHGEGNEYEMILYLFVSGCYQMAIC